MNHSDRREGRNSEGLAVALTGGGARGAYQVGVLRALGKHFPDLDFPIVTGVSAGAINAAFLASHPQALGQSAEALTAVWQKISFDDVFRIDLPWMAGNVWRWLLRLGSGGRHFGSPLDPRGLLDTTPLRALLERVLGTPDRIAGIGRKIERGDLEAIALATVNYGTGQTVNWVQGRQIETWERPTRRSHRAELTLDHVLASSSLPLIFPAVRLGRDWFGDGGIRMEAPLSPALHLGARRILAISTRYGRSQSEADVSSIAAYPPPAQILGNLMNAIFLDVLDRDASRLSRLNDLLRTLPEDQRGGLRPVDVLLVRPSQDLGKLSARFEPGLPKAFRFLTRGLGTRETSSPDFLSLLMFHPGYIQELIAIGERDVESRLDDFRALADPAKE